MRFLYNIIILFYAFAIKIASFSNQKAKSWIEGRLTVFEDLLNFRNMYPHDVVLWFHCASLGEFEQGRALIEKIKKEKPHYKIVLSFFSPSGYEIRKNYEFADFVCYLPIDTPKNAKKFVNILNPQKVFFIKYEYWYNYIDELWKHKIPLYVVSAIFREKQIFFKFYGFWFRKQLEKIQCFFTQNQESNDLLQSVGIKTGILSGDARFDRVVEVCQNPLLFPELKILNRNKTIIIGSSWVADELMIANALDDLTNLTLIIAPHEVNKNRILELKKIFHAKKPILLSQLSETNAKAYELIIVDSIGKLSSIYQYGFAAYIGGGFGKGIHNILEAACWGMPIIFGPNYHKFYEAKTLVQKGSAFSVKNSEEFLNTLKSLLLNNELLKKASITSRQFVYEQKGVVDAIYEAVFLKE
ncbi:MAG: glycosyltransferase N-terminal domain-containing protein [Bacteroidales bacterium]|nr:glycosyltransferase N-terminal domain-containing protein [Bacteroidales bacterium]